jgi:F-type H+-transporting ATPase subunit c
MSYSVVLAFILPFSVSLAAIGAGMGLGKAVSAAMDAVGRQPEASTKILILMATGCAFIEAVAIYTLIFAFVLIGKIQ